MQSARLDGAFHRTPGELAQEGEDEICAAYLDLGLSRGLAHSEGLHGLALKVWRGEEELVLHLHVAHELRVLGTYV